MTAQPSNSPSLPADNGQHLSRLRALVERVMADGKISADEAQELRDALMADGHISADEVDLIRAVMQQQLKDRHLEFE